MTTGTRPAAALWILGAVVFFGAEALAALVIPGYDYGLDYISRWGNPAESPRAALMNTAFVVQGAGFVIAGLLVARAHRSFRFLVFAVANGIGNVLVAVVHGGHDSGWHVVGAALAILGGNGAAIAGSGLFASRPYRAASMALGVLGLVCLAVLAAGPDAGIGAWERGAVYPIFGWQLLAAVTLLRRQRAVHVVDPGM